MTNDKIKKKTKTAIKVSLVLLTNGNALFRILSIVVMVVFFRYLTVVIIIASTGILIVIGMALYLRCL